MKTFKITWPDFSFKLALLRLPTQNENLSLKLSYLSNMIHKFQYKETGNVPSPNNFFWKVNRRKMTKSEKSQIQQSMYLESFSNQNCNGTKYIDRVPYYHQ